MHPGMADMTEGMGFFEKLDVPRFDEGVTPHETAEFFRKIGQPKKAEAAVREAANTPNKVIYILTDPGVGGFKKRGETGVSYVSVDTLGQDFQREVVVHEGVHNAHERQWGKIDVPGWNTMTGERKQVVFDALGISESFGEVSGVEALTQYATQKAVGETQSSYDDFEVPLGVKLFSSLGEKSGKSMIGAFLNMSLHGNNGGKEEFADGMRIGANTMLLERALIGKVLKTEEIARAMSKIIEAQKSDFVIRDMAHAQKLVNSYLEAKQVVGIVPGRNSDEELIGLTA